MDPPNISRNLCLAEDCHSADSRRDDRTPVLVARGCRRDDSRRDDDIPVLVLAVVSAGKDSMLLTLLSSCSFATGKMGCGGCLSEKVTLVVAAVVVVASLALLWPVVVVFVIFSSSLVSVGHGIVAAATAPGPVVVDADIDAAAINGQRGALLLLEPPLVLLSLVPNMAFRNTQRHALVEIWIVFVNIWDDKRHTSSTILEEVKRWLAIPTTKIRPIHAHPSNIFHWPQHFLKSWSKYNWQKRPPHARPLGSPQLVNGVFENQFATCFFSL